MSKNPPCLLTAKDYSLIEFMLERCPPQDTLLRNILQCKLGSARVVVREDLPPHVVTLNSRVRYRVNDAPAEIRLVGQDEIRGPLGAFLSITQPRGLALLGLSEGDVYRLPQTDSSEDTIQVLEVVYQPEAAMRERSKVSDAPGVTHLRLVHSVSSPPTRFGLRTNEHDDDPGPSAA